MTHWRFLWPFLLLDLLRETKHRNTQGQEQPHALLGFVICQDLTGWTPTAHPAGTAHHGALPGANHCSVLWQETGEKIYRNTFLGSAVTVRTQVFLQFQLSWVHFELQIIHPRHKLPCQFFCVSSSPQGNSSPKCPPQENTTCSARREMHVLCLICYSCSAPTCNGDVKCKKGRVINACRASPICRPFPLENAECVA